MPREENGFDDLMARHRSGDDVSETLVFHRDVRRLIVLAARQFDAWMRDRADVENVVLYAYNSRFLRNGRGEFDLTERDELCEWDELWSLLAVMTLRKCTKRRKHLCAARRDARRQVELPAGHDDAFSDQLDAHGGQRRVGRHSGSWPMAGRSYRLDMIRRSASGSETGPLETCAEARKPRSPRFARCSVCRARALPGPHTFPFGTFHAGVSHATTSGCPPPSPTGRSTSTAQHSDSQRVGETVFCSAPFPIARASIRLISSW
jgi:hypothetical protein